MSDPVRKAAAALGGLSSYGRVPDPELKREAERSLALARIDREIRQTLAKYGPLDGVNAAHLVGLLLACCHVSYDVAAPIEALSRAAVRDAQHGRDA